MTAVSAQQFATRLAQLCVTGVGLGLPNKRIDQQLLLMSIRLTLEAGRRYEETELNAAITRWKAEVGINIDLDHVSLRRHLVDEGYVVRDPAGNCYQAAHSRSEDLFDPAIAGLDQGGIIRAALERRERRKQAHQSGGE